LLSLSMNMMKQSLTSYILEAITRTTPNDPSRKLEHATKLAEKFDKSLAKSNWNEVRPDFAFTKQLSAYAQDPVVSVAYCHGLGYLADISKTKIVESSLGSLLDNAINFMDQCTPEVSLAQKPLGTICSRALTIATTKGNKTVMSLVGPMYRVLNFGTSKGSSVLTSVHTCVLQACLQTKCYHIGMRVLSKPIFEVQPSKTGFKIEDYNKYWYYAARVYIGCKKYKQAQHALIQCIATPSTNGTISMVAVEAYQLLVLVSLIADGQPMGKGRLPGYVSSGTLREVETCAQVFKHFGELFKKQIVSVNTDGLAVLQEYVHKNEKEFKKRKTTGLVQRCLEAFVRHKIASQTVTYVTLSLADLARAAGISSEAEAEEVVLDMISQGQISATVDQAAGVVAFLDDKTAESGTAQCPGLLQKITTETLRMLKLATSLREKDESLTQDEAYVKKYMPKAPGTKIGGRGGAHGASKLRH